MVCHSCQKEQCSNELFFLQPHSVALPTRIKEQTAGEERERESGRKQRCEREGERGMEEIEREGGGGKRFCL